MPKKVKKSKAARPPAALPSPGSFRVEVRPAGGGKRRVLVCACDEICAYSRERVSFRYAKETVTVLGEGLWCRTYAYRTAEVIGQVGEIVFGNRETEKV